MILESSTTSCVKRGGPVSVAIAHIVIDGIKDHELVFVAKNQADGLGQQITQLGHFLKAPEAEMISGWSSKYTSPFVTAVD
jgi:hypothetical protein